MKFVIAFLSLMSVVTLAETTVDTTVPSTTLTTETAPSNDSRVIGAVELRPSYISNVGEFHTENYVQLGYQFSKTVSAYYRQEFNTNLYNPGTSAFSDVYAYDGSARTKIGNIWADSQKFLSLSYEGRVYLPTYSVRRDAGMITAIRNTAKLKAAFTPNLSVALEEIPIVHIFNRAGTANSKGGQANPAFENRVYLTTEYLVTDKVKLSVPLILSSTSYRDFQAGAKNNDSWGHKVWLHPELTYALNPQLTLGAAFYSDNLVAGDFSETTFSEGLKKGVPQIILNAAI